MRKTSSTRSHDAEAGNVYEGGSCLLFCLFIDLFVYLNFFRVFFLSNDSVLSALSSCFLHPSMFPLCLQYMRYVCLVDHDHDRIPRGLVIALLGDNQSTNRRWHITTAGLSSDRCEFFHSTVVRRRATLIITYLSGRKRRNETTVMK